MTDTPQNDTNANSVISTQGVEQTDLNNSGLETSSAPANSGFSHPCIVPVGDIAQSLEAPALIGRPFEGSESEIALQPGQTYFFNFSEDDVTSFVQDGDNLVLSFADGSQLTLLNFDAATSGDLPSVLAFSDVMSVEGFETAEVAPSQSDLVDVDSAPEVTVISEQGEQVSAVEFISTSADNVANIEPAAGDNEPQETNPQDLNAIAQELAQIAPEAGDDGGSAEGGRGGFGFQSGFSAAGIIPISDIGPIDPTALQFDLPVFTEDDLIITAAAPAVLDDPEPLIFSPAPQDLDETDLDNGVLTVTDTVVVDFGADAPGMFMTDDSFDATGSLLNGTLASGGQPVVVETTATGYTGTIDGGATTVFTFTIDPETGEYVFTQPLPLDHADGTDPDDVITLEFGVKATDSNGDVANTTVEINVADDAPIVEDEFAVVDETDLPGPVVVAGTVEVDNGQDVPAGIVMPNDTFEAGGSLLGGNLTSNGEPVVVTLNGTTYTGVADGQDVFTLDVQPDGSYTFELLGTLDHADVNDPNDIITLEFGVKAGDFDGDQTPATIVINVLDDVPAINDAAGDVDESNLDGGPLTTSNTLFTDFGADVASITPEGTFMALVDGNMIPLTSGGVPVDVVATPNGYVGTINGGVDTIFTLTIDPETGRFDYVQNAPLDHPDSTDPNDVIDLKFTAQVESNEGEIDTADIVISVGDDGPVAEDDVTSAEEGQTITGDLFDNDARSEDTPNTVTQVEFDGQTFIVEPATPAVITTPVGELTVNSDGTYTFVADGNDPDATVDFTYTITDVDGDSDTADLSIVVSPDGSPVSVRGEMIVDETNLQPGPLVTVGQVDVDFGLDGAGTVDPNGNFSFSESALNDTLTSEGVPVVVEQVAGGYIGRAGTNTIFTLQVDPATGEFTFELIGTLDHADATDPNDAIRLNFGVTATDADDDTVDGSIEILVLDDAPVALDDANNAEEGQTITGSLVANDALSEDTPNTVTEVEFDGSTFAVPENGSADITTPIGTLTVNSDGTYSFTAIDPASGPFEDVVVTYTLVDSDGDSDTAELTLSVTPDGAPLSVGGAQTVDETNLDFTPLTTTGQVGVDFGVDGPGSVVTNDTFTFGQSVANGVLTSGGQPVTVTETPTGYIGTINGGADTVFTLDIDPQTFEFDFTLVEPLDHADSTDPNDTIELNFGVVATDANGDEINGTIDILVNDDAPVALDDLDNAEEGQTINGSVVANDEFSEDEPNTVTEVEFDGQTFPISAGNPAVVDTPFGELTINDDGSYTFVADEDVPVGGDVVFTYSLTDSEGDTDTAELTISVTPDGEPVSVGGEQLVDETNLEFVPLTTDGLVNVNFGPDGAGIVEPNGGFAAVQSVGNNGVLSSDGNPVTVTEVPGGYVGTINGGATTVFTLDINPETLEFEFELLEPLDHANPDDPNDVIELQFGITATDEDGDAVEGTLDILVVDDAPVAFDDIDNAEEGQTINGTVVANDELSEDDPSLVTEVEFDGQTFPVSAGNPAVIDTPFGDLTLNEDGTYTFEADADVPVGGDVVFTYSLTDEEGDTDTAELTISVTPDGEPQVVGGQDTVDETSLTPGPATVSGAVNVDFGPDGPGMVMTNDSFDAVQSVAGGVLSSDGVPVVVTETPTGYVGTAGAVTVFELTLASDGSYDFVLNEPLDHANSDDPNDVIELQFGIKAVDEDGDIVNGTLDILVVDDAPVALDDVDQVLGGETETGTVITNDEFSEDEPSLVTEITFNGVTLPVPVGGTTIEGQFGDLTIQQDGSYSYVADPNNTDGNVVDVFTYALEDAEGDQDTAELVITVLPNPNDVPELNDLADLMTDETDFNPTDSDSNIATADFGDDGPGTFEVNDTFSFDTNDTTNGTLTSNGVAVVVALVGNSYVGSANGEEVFRLDLNETTGQYTFTQSGVLDHADTTDPDDTIELFFGIDAVDEDGDRDSGTVRVLVDDDGPRIDTRTNSFDEDELENGPIVVEDSLNFDFGEDGPGEIAPTGTVMVLDAIGGQPVPLTSNGEEITFAVNQAGDGYVGTLPNGDVAITITIDPLTAEYVYTQNVPVDHANPDQVGGPDTLWIKFEVDVTDFDGDTDQAFVQIDIRDDGPVVGNATSEVDETGGFDSVSGSVAADAGVDGSVDGVVGSDIFSATDATLTSGGQPVEVNFNANTNTYVGSAGGQTVFTLSIEDDGDYTFTQNAALDHPNTNSSNDNIALDFGVILTDADGDSDTGNIRINVRDDGPRAVNDSVNVTNANITSGNVLGNDDAGLDGNGEVVSFTVNGQTVAAGGTIATDLGTIRLNADGSFVLDRPDPTITTSTSTSTSSGGRDGNTTTTTTTTTTSTVEGGTLSVSYTLRDGDNDTDTAVLTLNITPIVDSSSTNVTNGGGIQENPGGDGDGATPLVLDLDGDGIELLDVENGVLFDIDVDGEIEQTAFAGPDDGLLAIDLNGDGEINNRAELFGDTHGFADGFANLASYDSNGDGVINADDDAFGDLLIFQDLNSDGISQDGELHSLADIDIASINLDYTSTDYYINGQFIGFESTFNFTDGTEGQIVDAFFNFDEVEGGGVLFAQDNIADVFIFEAISEDDVTISNFDVPGGDVLDLSALIEDFDPLQDDINEFVFTTEVDGNTHVAVDVDGAGGEAAAAVAILENVVNLDTDDSVII